MLVLGRGKAVVIRMQRAGLATACSVPCQGSQQNPNFMQQWKESIEEEKPGGKELGL